MILNQAEIALWFIIIRMSQKDWEGRSTLGEIPQVYNNILVFGLWFGAEKRDDVKSFAKKKKTEPR